MPSYSLMEEHKLTKKEKKELRRLEWQEKTKTEVRNAKVKKLSLWGVTSFVILVVVLVLFQAVTASPSKPQDSKIAPISARDISTGNPKAKVTLIEYADFQCPACALYHSLIDQLLSEYGNKIFYVYRMFPLTNSHQNALISAQAAYAAHKQGKFIEYGNILFQKQDEWAQLQDPKTVFKNYAALLKLDLAKFGADMVSSDTQKYVQDSESEALSAGINQTPTFFLNGKQIQGPNDYAGFKKLIDTELNK